MLKAILTDPEARDGDTPDVVTSGVDRSHAGHLREPLLWWISVLRGLNAQKIGTLRDTFDDFVAIGTRMEEIPHSPPSVFGYYSPGYLLPQSGYNAPEFQIESTAAVAQLQNDTDSLLLNGVFSGYQYDLSPTGQLVLTAANDPDSLLDWLDTVFMHGQMPPEMRSLIDQAIEGEPLGTQVKDALYLTLTSPQYKIIQ